MREARYATQPRAAGRCPRRNCAAVVLAARRRPGEVAARATFEDAARLGNRTPSACLFISRVRGASTNRAVGPGGHGIRITASGAPRARLCNLLGRSEERRVGKECR